MTCLWLTITHGMSSTRLIAFYPSSPSQVVTLRCIFRLTKKKTFDDGTISWELNPLKYVQQAVKNAKTLIKSNLNGRYSLPRRANNPFQCDYASEEDISLLL